MIKPSNQKHHPGTDGNFPCLYLSCSTESEAETNRAAMGLPESSIRKTSDAFMLPIQWPTFRDYVVRHIPWYDEKGWQRAFLMFLSHHPIMHHADEMLERYSVDRNQCSFKKPAADETQDFPFRAEILDYPSGAALNIQAGPALIEIGLEKTRSGDYRPTHLDGSFAAIFPFEADLRTLWAEHGFASTREIVRELMTIMRESDWMPIAGSLQWQEGDVFRIRLQ